LPHHGCASAWVSLHRKVGSWTYDYKNNIWKDIGGPPEGKCLSWRFSRPWWTRERLAMGAQAARPVIREGLWTRTA